MSYIIGCFKKYAVFAGRARRSEYWFFSLFIFIVDVVLLVIDKSMISYYIFILAYLLPAWAVGVRRMHDVGKNGWFLLIPIYSLILLFTKGDVGDNKYGSDPKGFLESQTGPEVSQ